MAQSSHYFIGIPIEESLRSWLADWQNQLEKAVSYKTWTNKEDFHITLKFLGAVNEKHLEHVIELMDNLDDIDSIHTEIGGLGFFGKSDQPRVMWAGVEHTPQLLSLQNKIEEQILKLDFGKENRPYRPHITLAKKWADPQKKLESKDELANSLPKPDKQMMEIHSFHLYQIEPQNEVKYKPIFTKKLK
ncbi:RNA 2',3'-cyclic phosphodiesterase [Salinibacillus xinjiangensis]|uniref:RNA 2',3'-cyclic phosphodiesterase n=1 Tax=Salinibacillus xinjiangensis TaxID=1229268 RepID=A0A6G1XA48_9BACI|nr:RNA 2',3'-cyclic phosphodiesterase [Salinibacillus xinjiangensis]MRG87750.1 RNA 2',3'-cyclic phosphodiesterase [Salinibacillus xinjiangensis]